MCTGGSLALAAAAAAAAAAAGNTCSRHKYIVWISCFWNTALGQWVIGCRRIEAAEYD